MPSTNPRPWNPTRAWKVYDNVAVWNFLGRLARGDKKRRQSTRGTCVGKCPPRRGLLPTFLTPRWCKPRPSLLSLTALPFGTFLAEERYCTAWTAEAARILVVVRLRRRACQEATFRASTGGRVLVALASASARPAPHAPLTPP